nr:zinc finger, CCHC-type [Tanacetum cinerariifolium]
MSVVYVLTTPMPENGGDNPTVEQVRKRAKYDNDDYVCRGLILNGMSHSLFDIYQNVKTFKELRDTLEAKYMADDASSKKFIVSNFTNYKMTDSRPVLEHYNKLFDFKHTLKHLKEELNLVELGSHLRIEESLRAHDNNKPNGNNVAGPSVVNMVEHNNSSMYNDNRGATVHVCKDRWWFKTYESLMMVLLFTWEMSQQTWCMDVDLRLSHVHFKRMQDMSKDGLILAFDIDTEKSLTDVRFGIYVCFLEESQVTILGSVGNKPGYKFFFNELMDTPLDFSNFLINRLKVDTLTLELLVGPTYELMKGSCKSLIELEYHLEEVYKATTDQLDWVNPEGASSRKYTTSITKTKAADYGDIKWIEDLVPRTMWIEEPIGYDKHALWGVSHWGRKRQQFYDFAVNRESARNVYSKRRIIAVTKLKIIEWHNYKNLNWITVRRDDDKLYKFKEGDFKRLRIQDIEDMLLLLVQGKLTNLTVEECFAFNVSLRMFTRSIVIQRCVEDLQLGVESCQKKLNLTKPDSYRSDLKRKEAYTAYSNPRGFIYQNKDRMNRLTRIDEFHKFSDRTLNDVCTALDDHLKGIQMQYLPQSIWKKSDKERAAAMI